MTSEHRKRSLEASMPEISESERRLIETLHRDPERVFQKLEDQGYKIPGRKPRLDPDQWE